MRNNRNLLVIAVIAVVNALGYGIIIPILYTYSKKFGLSDLQNGLLFSLFSVCQFISTPIIGRLSDKWGRKPLLIISLIGTAVSFLMMASAKSALILFLARALDGLTAGNITVAQAVISDTTEAKDRAKGFGIMGAAFGFGFIFGPAISGLTIKWGLSTPFWIAASVTVVSIIMTMVLLPETNKHKREVENKKFFDLKPLWQALENKEVAEILVVTLLYSFGWAMFTYAYQPFAVKVLNMSVQQIAEMFTWFGVIGVVTQTLLLPKVIKKFKEKSIMLASIAAVGVAFLGMFFARNILWWIIATTVMSLANVFVAPMAQAILSKETDEKSQGSILGVNASYASLGFIFGPIVGGIVATLSIPAPFLLGAFISGITWIVGAQVLKGKLKKQHAF